MHSFSYHLFYLIGRLSNWLISSFTHCLLIHLFCYFYISCLKRSFNLSAFRSDSEIEMQRPESFRHGSVKGDQRQNSIITRSESGLASFLDGVLSCSTHWASIQMVLEIYILPLHKFFLSGAESTVVLPNLFWILWNSFAMKFFDGTAT